MDFLVGTLTAFLPLPPAWHQFISAGRCAMAEGGARMINAALIAALELPYKPAIPRYRPTARAANSY